MKKKIIRVGTKEDNWIERAESVLYAPIFDDKPIVDIEDLADFCDQDAESRNNHRFVGVHKLLAAILYKHLGREKSTIIMHEIAEYGGLDGMMGYADDESSFSDFGLEQNFKKWKLG